MQRHTIDIRRDFPIGGLKRASWDIEKDSPIILPAGSFRTPLLVIISAWKPEAEQGDRLNSLQIYDFYYSGP